VSAERDQPDAPRALLGLYNEALPVVYGYFVRRCPDRSTAEDLTSETFLAAMDRARRADPLTVLRADDLPVQPDPAFAARLRSRLESAVSLPARTEGVVMSGTDQAVAKLSEPTAAAPPRPAALPYLADESPELGLKAPGPRKPQRNDHRPFRAPLDAQRSGPRSGRPYSAR
jgi:Sigma-70 region 2